VRLEDLVSMPAGRLGMVIRSSSPRLLADLATQALERSAYLRTRDAVGSLDLAFLAEKLAARCGEELEVEAAVGLSSPVSAALPWPPRDLLPVVACEGLSTSRAAIADLRRLYSTPRSTLTSCLFA
jgi:hypothetical protein